MIRFILIALFAGWVAGCQSTPVAPIKTVENVDLERFMGDWFVVANIPTPIERDAFNALESYALESNNRVATTFRFNKGGFEGRVKTYRPTGIVRPYGGNAIWDMQFLWPFRAEYRIIFLDRDYQTTVIGRSKRDYVWIMSRTPTMNPTLYDELIYFLKKQGYDTSEIRPVPQRWIDGGKPFPDAGN